jgi:hypothetical protein
MRSVVLIRAPEELRQKKEELDCTILTSSTSQQFLCLSSANPRLLYRYQTERSTARTAEALISSATTTDHVESALLTWQRGGQQPGRAQSPGWLIATIQASRLLKESPRATQPPYADIPISQAPQLCV